MATFLRNLRIKKVDFVDAGANQEAHIKITKQAKKENKIEKFFSSVAKALGISQEECKNVVEQITKQADATTFKDTFKDVEIEEKKRKVADEIWNICYALQTSIHSILFDDKIESDKKETLMKQSIEEFNKVITESTVYWSKNKKMDISIVENDDMTLVEAKLLKEKSKQVLEKAEQVIQKNLLTETIKSEGVQEMKINKSKLSPAELAFLKQIEKQYGEEEQGNSTILETKTMKPFLDTQPLVASIKEEVLKELKPVLSQQSSCSFNESKSQKEGEIYKGLSPEIAKELEELRKKAAAVEEKELTEIAKKYEIIGKKAEELVPVLKRLKNTSEEAYQDMIQTLDTSVEVVQKSGMFSEFGKNGHDVGETDAWGKLETIATQIQKSAPTMNRTEAIDLACRQNPHLLQEYENSI